MRVQNCARQIARVFTVGLLGVHCLAAQRPVPPTAPALSNAQQVQLHSYLEQAAEAMHKGDNAAAAEDLRSALKIDSHSIAALNNLGIVLARTGKPAEAIPLYEDALKFHPGDPSTERNLALAYFKAQRYKPAWRMLQPLTAKYPTDFQILDLAGLSLFALDRYPEAATYLERASQADPSDLETLDMLGKTYLRMKNFKVLTSTFARIMQLNPNSASAHIMMATAYDQTSRARILGWDSSIGGMARTNSRKKSSARNCNIFPATRFRTAFLARSFWINPCLPMQSLIFARPSP
jgi:Flp pilus assembly protein TadD